MKNIILTTAISFFAFSATFAQNMEEQKVQEAVTTFCKSADQRNITNMDNIMDENFMVIGNGLFGSKEVSITNKETYLQLLKDQKIGGDSRKVTFIATDINDNNAVVKAEFDGSEYIFTTYIQLAKNEQGLWKIVSDMPQIKKKG